MRYRLLQLLAIAILLASPVVAQAPPTDDVLQSRANVIELAHAFTDEGFIVRDGFWRTELKPGEEQICGLQLFANVDYWICLGAGVNAEVDMALFSSGALPVPVHERIQEPSRAAIRVRPKRSGTFYLKLRSVRGEGGRVCVTYCYK